MCLLIPNTCTIARAKQSLCGGNRITFYFIDNGHANIMSGIWYSVLFIQDFLVILCCCELITLIQWNYSFFVEGSVVYGDTYKWCITHEMLLQEQIRTANTFVAANKHGHHKIHIYNHIDPQNCVQHIHYFKRVFRLVLNVLCTHSNQICEYLTRTHTLTTQHV